MANPKRTQVSDEGETLREELPATDRHDQDWQAAAEEVREAADEAGQNSS